MSHILNKVKVGLLNVGLKYISVDEKLIRMFLGTSPSNLEKIVILPVAKMVFQKFITKMGRTVHRHGFVHNGMINGVRVSVIRCQIGSPFAAIMMECLHRAKVQKVIRCDFGGFHLR